MFRLARLTQATELRFDAPFAQHAWSPANALDAVSIAAATKTVVVIFIMVHAETRTAQEPFIFSPMISPCHSGVRIEKLITTTGSCPCRDIDLFRAVTFESLTPPVRAADCRLRPSTPV